MDGKVYLLILIAVIIILILVFHFSQIHFKFVSSIFNTYGATQTPRLPVVFSSHDLLGQQIQQYSLMTINTDYLSVSVPLEGSFRVSYNSSTGPITKVYSYNDMKQFNGKQVSIGDVSDQITIKIN